MMEFGFSPVEEPKKATEKHVKELRTMYVQFLDEFTCRLESE